MRVRNGICSKGAIPAASPRVPQAHVVFPRSPLRFTAAMVVHETARLDNSAAFLLFNRLFQCPGEKCPIDCKA